jgi:alkyl hydroperoxide reductase subunit AhpF
MSMPLIGPDDAEAIRQEFEALASEVKLTLVGPSALSPPARDLTPQIRQLLAEIVALSPKLSLEVLDLPTPEQRGALALEPGEGGPITVVSGAARGKVRFVGAPAGHEFPNLVRAIVDASRGRSELSQASRQSLAKIARSVHIKVFVTPT